jgi:hypothetical protein
MIERQVTRGFIAAVDVIPPLVVTFQFNPESISDNKAVNYADRNANSSGDAPGKVYTGGGHRTISFDLKLHGLEQGTNVFNPLPEDNGISTELAKLRSFMYPKADAWASIGSKEGKRLSAPPTCIFGFGTKILECVVTDLTITEAQFNSALAPVRADVKITLTVIQEGDNKLYKADQQHRNALAALGAQNVKIF